MDNLASEGVRENEHIVGDEMRDVQADVPAGSVSGLSYKPTLHVHYGEKVMTVRDGLPKFKDFPKDFGGSGDTVPE